MSVHTGLFTSESVSAGHPDKLCDRISDAFLDAFLEQDSGARVACETFAADQKIIVAGEFRSFVPLLCAQIRERADGIVRQTLKEVGYGDETSDIDPRTCAVEIMFNQQSPDIASGIGAEGAGDQGLMFGHACDETPSLMPLAWTLANNLVQKAMSLQAKGGFPLRPDGKAQVTVRYRDGRPEGVEAAVISWQHDHRFPVESLRDWLTTEVLLPVIPLELRTAGFRSFINPAGPFTIGGPKGDTGLTGRKIIVDTYGGACPHGGGAFSGKDPSKVDRSGAYAGRAIAKHIVASGVASRATVQLAYAIGVSQPVSVSVDSHGTAIIPDALIARLIPEFWDLSPRGISNHFRLQRPIYKNTSSLGHFGEWRDPSVYRWEDTQYASDFREFLERSQAGSP
jgi:S-adenosylmethionine synthetase